MNLNFNEVNYILGKISENVIKAHSLTSSIDYKEIRKIAKKHKLKEEFGLEAFVDKVLYYKKYKPNELLIQNFNIN